MQVINKKTGVFNEKDKRLLEAFAAQACVALENAKLFDQVESMRNYLHDMIESLSNGIVTVDEDGIIKTVNSSFCKMILYLTYKSYLDKSELFQKVFQFFL